MFNINVRAPFIFCKEFSREMTKKKWGRIVNIGSTASYNGFLNMSNYCTSKHAILGLSRSIRLELIDKNVRVFCVSFGTALSEMGKIVEDKLNLSPDTFIDPKEIAEYIVHAITFDKEMMSEEIRLNRVKEHIEQH
jgi:NAD(P)-dependent dehydrogenase (short-subunit alcohol dehydrogenase family)